MVKSIVTSISPGRCVEGEEMKDNFADVYIHFFETSIQSLDQLKKILKQMRVTFEERITEYNHHEILVRGNLVFSYSDSSLTAWLSFSDFLGFTTQAEFWMEDKDVTIGNVVSFCEEYHRRILLRKFATHLNLKE